MHHIKWPEKHIFLTINLQINLNSSRDKIAWYSKKMRSNGEIPNGTLPVISHRFQSKPLSAKIRHKIQGSFLDIKYGISSAVHLPFLPAFSPLKPFRIVAVKIYLYKLPINVKIPVVLFIIFSLWFLRFFWITSNESDPTRKKIRLVSSSQITFPL